MHCTKEYLNELERSARERKIPVLLGESAEYLIGEVRKLKPKRILEIGTAIGYSAILILANSDDSATIDTIERDTERAEEARKHFDETGLSERVRLYVGDSRDILPKLKDNRYDLIFMDGGKSRYHEDILMLESMLTGDGIIFTDNVLFKGMVRSEEVPRRGVRSIVNNLRKYLDIIENQTEYETELIEAGDGITITRKKR